MATRNSRPIKIQRYYSSSFDVEIDLHKSKQMPTSKTIYLPAFTAGDNDWKITYFPKGNKSHQECPMSLLICLRSNAKDITAEFSFKIISELGRSETISKVITFTFAGYGSSFSPHKFISQADIQNYNINDIFVISCNLRVIDEPIPRVLKNYSGGLREQIEKLRDNKESCDITFEVGGESNSAHKLIMAARSPVFEALLFESMAERKMQHIKIDEMTSEVFRALIQFVYSDKLMLDASSNWSKLLQGLFVAADRYAIEKLRELCEHTLAASLSVNTVMTNLLLADQHNCAQFKKKCIDFISHRNNFKQVAQTDEYFHIIDASPSIFAELQEKLGSKVKRRCSCPVVKRRKLVKKP